MLAHFQVLLSTYFVDSIVLGACDPSVSKTDQYPCLWGAYISCVLIMEKTCTKQLGSNYNYIASKEGVNRYMV